MHKMKSGCQKIIIRAGIGFVLVVALGVYSFHKDFTLRRSKDAQDMVKAEFGYGNSISNEYFIVFGFLQGCDVYYRFDTTEKAALEYVENKRLTPVSDKQGIKDFTKSSPYWWQPEKGTNVKYFGVGSRVWMSWDKNNGRCHIYRKGG
jgi:hypothetical protein